MKSFENNKGITLVSLIVTIIIMFVLAGVVISTTVSDENGVITKAEDAVDKSTIAAEKENIELIWYNLYPGKSNITVTDLVTELNKQIATAKNKLPEDLSDNEKWKVNSNFLISPNNNKFEVDEHNAKATWVED